MTPDCNILGASPIGDAVQDKVLQVAELDARLLFVGACIDQSRVIVGLAFFAASSDYGPFFSIIFRGFVCTVMFWILMLDVWVFNNGKRRCYA